MPHIPRPDRVGADTDARRTAHSQDLPRAFTLNGQCQEVCPVAIPLPTLLRGWRDRLWRDGLKFAPLLWGLGLWRFLVLHPTLYRLASRAPVACSRGDSYPRKTYRAHLRRDPAF